MTFRPGWMRRDPRRLHAVRHLLPAWMWDRAVSPSAADALGVSPWQPPPPAPTPTREQMWTKMEQARDLIASTGYTIEPWQDKHLAHVLTVQQTDPGGLRFIDYTSRRTSKTAQTWDAATRMAGQGEHVHVVMHDGLWCSNTPPCADHRKATIARTEDTRPG